MAYLAAPYEVAVDRFWSRVDMSGGPGACWPWTLSCYTAGYGQVWWEGRHRGAHVVAFAITTGSLPANHVLHRCDNPPCCNPAHLFEGTHDDNMADMVQKGRQHNELKVSRGSANGRAVLDEDRVRELRELAAQGAGHANLARQFGISDTHVRRVVRKVAWR